MSSAIAVPNPEAIHATYRWLAHGGHGVSEVRVIRPGGGILGIGFFDDEEAFVRECVRANAAGNVYVGIQSRPRRLFQTAPNVIRQLKTGATRKDIEVITGTVVDLDPVRGKDTASTEDELALALAAANTAAEWCQKQGFVPPRRVMSGNGYQLWFAIPPLTLTEENRERLQTNLKVFEAEIRKQVESEKVKVDSIHDFSRIIKVVGTVSHKGEATAIRPHRTSASLNEFKRIEDAKLAERLSASLNQSLSSARSAIKADSSSSIPEGGVSSPPANAKARRMPDGNYDWESPIWMCAPIQKLWEQGHEDRSLAIFNMVRWFAHKGLSLEEIIDLVLEYDRRGLGKLSGRDGRAYIKHCYDKIIATREPDGTLRPPCHSLQRMGYCRVNRDPGVRCEIYDYVFDIEKAAASIPKDTPANELNFRLKPVFEAIAHQGPAVMGRYVDLLQERFGLKPRDVRRAIHHAANNRERQDEVDARNDAKETGEAIEGEVWEDAASYYIVTGRGEAKYISSFAITPTMRVEAEGAELIIGDAHTDKGTVIRDLRFPLRAFNSRRDLIRHLPSADLQWTGNDHNAQGLLRVLARRPVPRRPGTTMLGSCHHGEEHLWVCPRGAITTEGFVEPSPVIYVPSGASLERRVRYQATDDGAFKAIASKIFEFLPKVNLPEVVIPVLGWFFATPMKPKFMAKVGSFPLLFIWGTPGSGKSSLVMDIFWPLFGVREAEPYSATETEFALLKLLSSTRSIPVFIDEYKPYDMQRNRLNYLHRHLRRLYRGEDEERGRADQTVSTYHLQAPVCVAGETRPTEQALLERILTANPEKATLEQQPDCRNAYRELRTVDLSLFATRYIQFCLKRNFDSDLSVVRKVGETLLAKKKLPLRLIENLTAMLLGVHLFEEFALACGYTSLPSDIGVQSAIESIVGDLVETEHGVKNALDHFIEMLGVMAVQGELLHGVHYVFREAILFVHLESAYDSFRQHCKRIDYNGEVVDLKALRRLIQENKRQHGYVAVESERVYFKSGADRRRAFGLDLSRTNVVSPDDFSGGDLLMNGSHRGYNFQSERD